MQRALVCSILAIVLGSSFESGGHTHGMLFAIVILLYAICHMLQSIHDFLKDLHARMDGGYPPAE